MSPRTCRHCKVDFEKCQFPACPDEGNWYREYETSPVGFKKSFLCERHKKIKEETWDFAAALCGCHIPELEHIEDPEHEEFHGRLFGNPEGRKEIVQCPRCGFFSLPYEPIFYQDSREGKEWAQWAENEYLKHERPWELPDPEEEAKARKKLEDEYFEEKRKQKERDARIAEKLKTLVITKKKDAEEFAFQCYDLNCVFSTNDRSEYERHVVTTHPSGTLCYPGKIDLKMRGWKAQGRKWEI